MIWVHAILHIYALEEAVISFARGGFKIGVRGLWHLIIWSMVQGGCENKIAFHEGVW